MPDQFFATGPEGLADRATLLSMSGLDFMQGMLDGTLPGGMELVWVTDDGRFIEASVQSPHAVFV